MKYHCLYLAARKIPLLTREKIYILRPERTPRDERSAASREAESQIQCLLVPYDLIKPCCQRISSWPFSECFEGIASSRCWSENVIDSHSSCHIPLNPDRQILRALNKFRERNSIFLNPMSSPKSSRWATDTSQILWRLTVPLLHVPLQSHMRAWADTHQRECTFLIGMDALGTSGHKNRKIQFYWYWCSCLSLRYVTL